MRVYACPCMPDLALASLNAFVYITAHVLNNQS